MSSPTSAKAVCAVLCGLALAGPAQAYTVNGFQFIFEFENPSDLTDGLPAATGLQTTFTTNGEIQAAGAGLNPDYPPKSGTHVVTGTSFTVSVVDKINISWPAIGAFVTGSAPIFEDAYAYNPNTGIDDLIGESEVIGPNFVGSGGGLPNAYLTVGSEADPLFLTSAQFFSASPFTLDNLTLGLPDVGPGIPEPATWTLMVAGLGLVGAALRRAKRAAAAA